MSQDNPNLKPKVHDWLKLERLNGGCYPADFKLRVNQDGFIKYNEELVLLNPLLVDGSFSLDRFKYYEELYKSNRRGFSGELKKILTPYSLGFEENGMTIFAMSVNGASLFFKTAKGRCEDKVLLFDNKQNLDEEFEGSFSNFFYRYINGEFEIG